MAQFQIDTDWHWDSWIPSVALLDTCAEYNKQADRRSWIAMQDFFKAGIGDGPDDIREFVQLAVLA